MSELNGEKWHLCKENRVDLDRITLLSSKRRNAIETTPSWCKVMLEILKGLELSCEGFMVTLFTLIMTVLPLIKFKTNGEDKPCVGVGTLSPHYVQLEQNIASYSNSK